MLIQIDCQDASDEANCTNTGCHPDQFKCNNGECISKIWTCDSEKVSVMLVIIYFITLEIITLFTWLIMNSRGNQLYNMMYAIKYHFTIFRIAVMVLMKGSIKNLKHFIQCIV